MSRLQNRGYSWRSIITLGSSDLILALAWGLGGLALQAALLMQSGAVLPSW